jgi:hypothetical protein
MAYFGNLMMMMMMMMNGSQLQALYTCAEVTYTKGQHAQLHMLNPATPRPG